MSCEVKGEMSLGTLVGISCWGLGAPLNAFAGFAERNSRTSKTEMVRLHTSNAHAGTNKTTNNRVWSFPFRD